VIVVWCSFIAFLCTVAFLLYVWKLLSLTTAMVRAAGLQDDENWNRVAKRTVRKFQIRLIGGGLLGIPITLPSISSFLNMECYQ
jgi:hypothetical protein